MAAVLLLRGQSRPQGVVVFFRIKRCILCTEKAADITPLSAAFQATWSTISILLHGKGASQEVAVVLRIERCILCIEMAAEITPLGAAFQATWSKVSDPEIVAKNMCQSFLGENTA